MIQCFGAAGIHVILRLSRGRKKRYNNCDLSEGREDSVVSVVECAGCAWEGRPCVRMTPRPDHFSCQ